LRCDDSETDDRVDRAGCRSLGIRSLVAVPIRQGSRVAGLLEVFSPQPYAFSADDIGALQQLMGNIRPVIGHPEEAHPAKVQAPSTIKVTPLPPERPARIEKPPAAKAAIADTERPVARTKPSSPPDSVQRDSAQHDSTQHDSTQHGSTQHASAQPSSIQAVPTQVSSKARSSQPSLAKALFVAAIGTFIFALLWLIAPWVSSTMRSSERPPSRAHAQPPQASVAKSPGLPPNVTDLASLRKVAEQGDPAAQFSLGARYATGEEVKQDYTEAVRWFTLAAEQGHILAQATLGAYYWAGRGVPQDLTKAYYWSVLAQAGGDQASKYRVAVLASRMSRSQVLAAQQQANDWLSNFASHPPASP